ncbi:unnamed protein product [Periconia digitata]|uniref:Uncharacterized protein n=1 Tax=Periconia digitata TaxID=1303443 RepID=A0A9W4UAG7_9PLEO|nr:unnamed protein product [Periconia digitata]
MWHVANSVNLQPTSVISSLLFDYRISASAIHFIADAQVLVEIDGSRSCHVTSDGSAQYSSAKRSSSFSSFLIDALRRKIHGIRHSIIR